MFWLKSRNKFATALLIVIAVLAIGSIMPQEWYDRMNTIETYEEDASALGRINAWWTGFNVANARFTGGGFEMYRYPTFQAYAPEPNRVHDVHSIYFEVLGEHGWLGLTFFLLLLGLTWLKCSHIIRFSKKRPDLKWSGDLAAMIQASMIGYMASGAFLGLAYFDYIYHLVALTVVTYHLITEEEMAAVGNAPIRQTDGRAAKPIPTRPIAQR